MTSSAPPTTTHTGLRTAVRGRVLLPGDAGFDDARLPWNRAVDQPVVAVVEAADADDVASLVRYAAEHEVGVSAQRNGHGATGRTAGSILLRTARLDQVSVEPQTRRAVVGAGVRSGALQAAAVEHGLTGLPGSAPVVSVAGVVLGGGLSWFGRAHGWISDSVTAFDVVDADGRAQHVTADADPDLFWALRGGGGDHAIVTAVELALHEAPPLVGGRLLWSGAHTNDVVDAYRALTHDAPDELTAWLTLLHAPGAEPLVAVDTAFLGDEARAARALAPLDALPAPVADTRRVLTVAETGSITADRTDPVAFLARMELLTDLDDAAAALLAESLAPLLSVQVRQLGGAFAQPSDSPQGPLTEAYTISSLGLPLSPEIAASVRSRQAELAAALPTSGRKPATFLGPDESIADAVGPDALERLRRIKSERDPAGVIRSGFPVFG